MPFYVRHLPGNGGPILDPSSIPKNHVIYNPSYASPIIYLRGTKRSSTDEKNYVILHNEETKKTKEIDSPWEMMAETVNLFKGIEDLRICWYKDRLWFSGTTTHMTEEMTNELIVGHFNEDLTKVERLSAVDIGSLPVKNVCPFVWKDNLCLLDIMKAKIYQVSEKYDEAEPTKFVKFVATTINTLKSGANTSIEGFRGSTSPVHLHGNTWGCVIHDIIFNDNTKLVTRLSYLHHWLEFDVETGHITYLSSSFWVAHWGIEYVSGIHYEKETGKVILYVGIDDRVPVIYHTTLDNLRIGK